MKSIILLPALLLSFIALGQSTANYTITFESIWESVTDNPTDGQSTIDLPSNAHWSPLVGATHQTANAFLSPGAAVTPGVESVAETGSTTIFLAEINANSDADQAITGGGLNAAKGTITINSLDVSEDYPLVTLASMIAPSPDWLIAVNSINLRSGNPGVNNGWRATFTIDLFPYDAGTEDGTMYDLSNPDTNPLGVMSSRSNITPFNDRKIGTFTFTYNSSTLSSTQNAINAIKIYPNPTKGGITISNIRNVELSSIEVYNVLGKLVKQIEVNNAPDRLNANLTHLNRGVYLLNLKASDGANTTQKLVIN